MEIDVTKVSTGFLNKTASKNSDVLSAIRSASQKSGIDFDYLLKTAQRESSLRPDAKAKTSSATGLFQFIDNTWLQTLKESGSELGLGRYADKIKEVAPNKFQVANADDRQKILNLRKDPNVAALVAGAFTKANATELQSKIGREPSGGELYIAHFLGASGAERLINLAEDRPGANAARAFPQAAKANKSIFYNKSGQARSASDVYNNLVRSHNNIGKSIATANAPPVSSGADSSAPVFATKKTVTDNRPLFAALFSGSAPSTNNGPKELFGSVSHSYAQKAEITSSISLAPTSGSDDDRLGAISLAANPVKDSGAGFNQLKVSFNNSSGLERHFLYRSLNADPSLPA